MNEETQKAMALAKTCGLQFVDLSELEPIPNKTLALLRNEVAIQDEALPISLTGDVVTVAISNPVQEKMDVISGLLHPLEARFYLAAPNKLKIALGENYSNQLVAEGT